MVATESQIVHRVLLVDDDDAVREMMLLTLQSKGFEVVAAASVTEALRLITFESFDVLITDLHMPNPADGFTVVTAMRHSQPGALILLVSGYPDVQSAMSAILLQADEIIVKPFDTGKLAELLRDKLLSRKPAAPKDKERVATILQRCATGVVEDWLARVKESKELNDLCLSDEERTGHLPKLIEDADRSPERRQAPPRRPMPSLPSPLRPTASCAILQGYTPAMLVQDSRILQVTLSRNLAKQYELSGLQPARHPMLLTIADEVDAQLTQSMESYMKVMQSPVAA